MNTILLFLKINKIDPYSLVYRLISHISIKSYEGTTHQLHINRMNVLYKRCLNLPLSYQWEQEQNKMDDEKETCGQKNGCGERWWDENQDYKSYYLIFLNTTQVSVRLSKTSTTHTHQQQPLNVRQSIFLQSSKFICHRIVFFINYYVLIFHFKIELLREIIDISLR